MNIKSLAKQLGFSVSTVSKALSDSHEISAETKKKVLDLAKQLNYTRNPYASSLRNKKSYNIAVVIPEVADTFFSLAINGIESVAQEKGYHVIIYLTHENPLKEQSILNDFRNGRVDGVMMSVSGETVNDEHIRSLESKNIPLVFFDRVMEGIPAARVVTDDFESCYNATAHLISKGCKKIAFLSFSDKLGIINRRLGGYKKALLDKGLPDDNSIVMPCSASHPENYIAIKKLLTSAERPDGIIGSVEKAGTDLYSICNEIGLHIPSDLKVIVYSNMQIAPLLNPPLSTITQPAFEMGRMAASLLFRGLEKLNFVLKDEKIIIPSVFIERASSGKHL